MANTRQRLFQQKGQVDTQWEMMGSPSALPSSEEVAEYDTTDSMQDRPANQSFGGAGNVGQKNEAGEAPFQQIDDPDTGEYYIKGPRFDSEVSRAYPDNWDDLAGS